MTFDHHHYVPILLTKRGERSAVSDLDAGVRANITPLFVVAPVDWNFDLDEPAKTVDAHLRTLAEDLFACWGTRRAFIDLMFLDPAARMSDGSHPLTWVTARGNAVGTVLLPTVGVSSDAAYQAAAAAVSARDGRGACIRLRTADWPSSSGARLTALLGALRLTPREVDLVLDLGEDVATAPSMALTAVRNELASLPSAHDWRTVTVAGASFPKQLTNVARGLSVIERVEWSVYSALLGAGLARIPTFGDYAVANPDPVVDVDPRVMNISASMRYTIDGAWLVSKGDLFKGSGGSGLGGAAAVPVADALVRDPRFDGAGHCTGDDWIIRAAAGSGGNPEAWRRAATAHHLTHVGRVVATLP